jgi:hypothetical protein
MRPWRSARRHLDEEPMVCREAKADKDISMHTEHRRALTPALATTRHQLSTCSWIDDDPVSFMLPASAPGKVLLVCLDGLFLHVMRRTRSPPFRNIGRSGTARYCTPTPYYVPLFGPPSPQTAYGTTMAQDQRPILQVKVVHLHIPRAKQVLLAHCFALIANCPDESGPLVWGTSPSPLGEAVTGRAPLRSLPRRHDQEAPSPCMCGSLGLFQGSRDHVCAQECRD